MTSSASPAPFEELASLRARVQQFESQIVERDALLEQRTAAIARHEVTIQQHEATIERLHEQVRLLLARRFGASSEKLPEGQLGLFNEAEAETGEAPEADAGTEVAAHRRARPVRDALPDTLERVDIEHELAQSERTCPHHGVELERFAEVVSEQLDIVPAKVRVLRHIRGKYRCPSCEGHLRTAPMPAQPLAKSFASPGLLAFIVTAKYVDGLPLYRQQQQFGRLGVELSRTTLARWVVGMGELVVPLMNLLHEALLERPYVLMDETTVQVLKEPGKAPESKSQLWAMMSPGPEPPIVVFVYDPSRSGDVPRRLLAGFAGALHTDGYSGYGPAVREYDLVHLACWAWSTRIHRCAEEPRTQPEEAAIESAGEGPARAACPAANPNALRHRTPYPRRLSRGAPPGASGRERPGARRASRLARRHSREGPALKPAGQGDGLPRPSVGGAGALLRRRTLRHRHQRCICRQPFYADSTTQAVDGPGRTGRIVGIKQVKGS